MQQFVTSLTSLLSDNGVTISGTHIPVYALRLLILVVVAVVIHTVAMNVIVPMLVALSNKTRTKIDTIILNKKLLRRAFHLLPVMIISAGLPTIMDSESDTYILILRLVSLSYTLIGLAVYDALLSTVRDLYDTYGKSQKVSINGAIQALKVVGTLIAVILAISLLAGKSPIYFFSGLGAFTAIIMLIFKDAILGLVAGVQLSAMDLVRKGDWIEIPKHGADGNVEDISLTTIKVRNWDRTVTAVPAYELVSSSFKNWRAMFEGGGRRIKRSIRFSVNSIRFLNKEEFDRLRKIKLLNSYLDEKLTDIECYNAEAFCNADMSMLTNGRRLTNIGTFRAYCDAYLRNHPGINQELIIMVRQLGPTEFGLPLELYAYTSDVRWIGHENIQSDIFDHLLAIVPEFGLIVYQR
ncbi:MAG: mechanosensitive ion channel family protein [Chitinispirillales bacterium]|nr:mechanosensitive ion channel family protein [Chitinispirillales bacterium]